ncbi:MAG: hypothetical protein PHX72_02210 [Candidatus Shapirobacteria bacterium]|nr:hypothetical protein [Candidatus Shapirobacteria bacterium]
MRKFIGLTLIEILVSSAVIMVVSGLGLAAYNNFNNRQLLDTTTNELRNNLRQVRGWAMAGKKADDCAGGLEGYQFSFGSVSGEYRAYMVCPGPVIVGTFFYDGRVAINSPSSTIFFQALTGETGENINISLSLGSRTRQLNIETNGEIN